MVVENIFACPRCKSTLDKQDDHFFCQNCKGQWDFISDIPKFSTHTFYWNRIPKERLDHLNQYAKDYGWQNALNELLPADEKYLIDYATHKSRADFKNIIPQTLVNSKILDLGCHMGGLSFLLATHCQSITAADSTFENLEFLQIRKTQDNIQNIFPVCIDPLDFASLPFADSCFDLVVLNGVLEWVGAVRHDVDPRQIQINALREIRRVIKPGGYLYIGIENRFSYSYFIGSHDHSGLPFTSIMPRRLANVITKIINRSEYRTYTYSYWGYQSLLKDAGFSDYKIYLAIPSYRYPHGLLDVKDKIKIKSYIKNSLQDRFFFRMLWTLLVALNLERVFSNSFSIVAYNNK
jgi:SAM-dependent methyltransferase